MGTKHKRPSGNASVAAPLQYGSERVNYSRSHFPPGMLAVPTIPWMYTEAAAAIGTLRDHLPEASMHTMSGAGSSSIAASRNMIVRSFLESDTPRGRPEWLLFVDADMTPRPDTAIRLLAIAEYTEADIVSALCFTRHGLFVPAAARVRDGKNCGLSVEEWDDGPGVISVDRVGMGCALIQRRVFEAIGDPWFQHPPEKPGQGEDYHFCERAKEHGFTIVVDTDFDCGHLSVMPITKKLARAFCDNGGADSWRDTSQQPIRIPEELLPR